GQVNAVYEIAQTHANAFETLEIPFSITYGNGAPLFQVLDGLVGLAPVGGAAFSDSTSPIPRFNNPFSFHVIAPLDPLRITTTTLPNTSVGASYFQTLQATGGTAPYAFTLASPTGSTFPPPGLTLASNGTLSGTAITAGTYRFTVIVRDSMSPSNSATKDFSITVSPPSATLRTSVSSLDFTAALSGAPPPIRPIQVTASAPGSLAFTITVDNGAAGGVAPAWLQVTPLSGKTPALVTVAVNQADMPVGTYNARIRIAIAGGPAAPIDIPVSLKITNIPAKLESAVKVLRFRGRVPAPGKQTGFVLLYNSGGNGQITYNATVVQKSSWISFVTPSTGLAGPRTPASVRVGIDTTGLAQGIYRDVLRFTSAAGNIDVPVVLRIAPAGLLLDTDKTGVRFSMTEGAFSLASREVKIFNREPSTTLQWTAEVLRGSDWLALASGNGIATALAPGSLKVGVKPAAVSLRAGAYYGLIRITAAGASYSPRYITVVLNVKASNLTSEIDVDRGGAYFTGVVRSTIKPSQTFTLNADSPTAVAFQAAASTDDGNSWLTVSPLASTVSSSKSETLTVTVDPTGLIAGVYTGTVTIATADSSQTLSITFVVVDPLSDAITPASARAAGACSPNRLAVANSGLPNSFAVPAGWPATL
ncbi:MAG: putative Ig domain-containing protein, partial [Acidobacteriota bacterium]